jgi:hypothetical protein
VQGSYFGHLCENGYYYYYYYYYLILILNVVLEGRKENDTNVAIVVNYGVTPFSSWSKGRFTLWTKSHDHEILKSVIGE